MLPLAKLLYEASRGEADPPWEEILPPAKSKWNNIAALARRAVAAEYDPEMERLRQRIAQLEAVRSEL